MAKIPGPPSFDGLKRRIARHRAESTERKTDHFVRETYRLGLYDARAKARQWFEDYPKAAYWTEVESWRQLDNDQIEFTMRRLPSAD
jgi:hypothetical protein